MDRIDELLYSAKQFLHDGETLIYIKDGKLQYKSNDGERLFKVTGNADEILKTFIKYEEEEE